MLQDPSFTQSGMKLKEKSVRLSYLWNNLLVYLSYCFNVSSELYDTEGCGYVIYCVDMLANIACGGEFLPTLN